MRLDKIYTKTGDGGRTSLVTGERVPKTALRIESVGAVDEVNSVVGLLPHQRAEHIGRNVGVHTLTQCAGPTERNRSDGFLSGLFRRSLHL